MFLNEPHSTHRYYGELLKANDYRVFREDHSLYPYYTSSFALILLEDFFRDNELSPKFKKFKYHMLLLFRLKAGGKKLPPFNSKDMDTYSKKVIDVLWKRNDALKVFEETTQHISKVLKSFDMYNITRLKKYTSQLTELPDLQITNGVVKYFNDLRGFGFIDIGQVEDVFVHCTDIKIEGQRTLREGQRVVFRMKQTDKGQTAEDVQIFF